MDPKKQPNHALYLQILRRMTPQQKIDKASQMSTLGRELMAAGIRRTRPDISDAELQAIVRRKLDACHNQNY
jgi:hypothetical protein